MSNTRKPKGQALAIGLLVVALAAPALLFVAVFGTRFGAWDAGFGMGVLALRVGRILAYAGLFAALVACLMAFRDRRLLGVAGAALLCAGLTAGGYALQDRRFFEAPRDVTSDPADPPQFARILAADRRLSNAPVTRAAACEGLAPAPTQVAPDIAARALEKAGFTVLGTSPFRVDGRQEGMWFGLTHDVTVRIRPGRTDVRVAARDALPVGDESCRLAKAVVAELTPR